MPDNKSTFYYIRTRNQIITGPFSQEKINQMRAQGHLNEGDALSTDQKNWTILGHLFSQPPEITHIPTPPPPPAPSSSSDAEPPIVPPIAMQYSSESHPPAAGLSKSALWEMIFNAFWFSSPAMEPLKPFFRSFLPFAGILSLSVCLLPWMLFPPRLPSHHASLLLIGASIGLCSWALLLLLSLIVPWLFRWMKKLQETDAPRSRFVSLYLTIHTSTLFGTLSLLRSVFSLPGIATKCLGILFLTGITVWCETAIAHLLRNYSVTTWKNSSSLWLLPFLITSLVSLAILSCVLYRFGDFQ